MMEGQFKIYLKLFRYRGIILRKSMVIAFKSCLIFENFKKNRSLSEFKEPLDIV